MFDNLTTAQEMADALTWASQTLSRPITAKESMQLQRALNELQIKAPGPITTGLRKIWMDQLLTSMTEYLLKDPAWWDDAALLHGAGQFTRGREDWPLMGLRCIDCFCTPGYLGKDAIHLFEHYLAIVARLRESEWEYRDRSWGREAIKAIARSGKHWPKVQALIFESLVAR
ncbi:hypothetical protein HY375_00370 [Candidatus Berkelbacteria bacterium]|nr:hypothetical protein [Candidatus Berkelbacteria bacterium]